MIGQARVGLTLGQDVQVLLDETFTTPQEKGDLTDLHLLLRQMDTADEGGQIVAHRLGTMVHDLADLRHRLALQG